jgi:thiamine-monophosphate kinase
VSGADTIASLGERALIRRVHDRLPPAPPWIRVGIGDDAAVVDVPARRAEVLTTDAFAEGVHFDRALVPARDIGHRAVAGTLSDLAAMGAEPRLLLLSLVLPDDLALADFDAMIDGVAEIAAAHRAAVAGGNITRSPGPLLIDVTAVGHVHPRKVLRRGGARAGDALYVSGQPGGAAAGLAWLRAHAASVASEGRRPVGADVVVSTAGPPSDGFGNAANDIADAVERYRRPQPRVRLGLLVGRTRAANACMDLSDGLADAVAQVAQASGLGAVLDLEAVPWHPAVAPVLGQEEAGLAAALASDDYELLFAVPARRRRLFERVTGFAGLPPVTRIGELRKGADLVTRQGGTDRPLTEGYEHFAGAARR